MDGVEQMLLLSGREVADLDSGKHLHTPFVNEGEKLRGEERQAYEALHLVLADAQLLRQNVP